MNYNKKINILKSTFVTFMSDREWLNEEFFTRISIRKRLTHQILKGNEFSLFLNESIVKSKLK